MAIKIIIIEDLEQYTFLKKEVEALERELLKTFKGAGTESDLVTGSTLEFPYVKATYKILGDDKKTRTKVKQLKHAIKERRQEVLNHRLAIEQYMKNIRDSEIRLIITLKYIKGLTWLAVSTHIYGNPSKDRARIKLERYLQKHNKL